MIRLRKVDDLQSSTVERSGKTGGYQKKESTVDSQCSEFGGWEARRIKEV